MNSAGKLVMLVDDDDTIIDTLVYNLKRHGFTILSCQSGQNALAKLNETSPHIIILDWTLPDMAGPDICKIIRSRSLDVPILMLTARSSPSDVAQGLLSGADDYLAKPFSMVELMARVTALLRRTKLPSGTMHLTVGGLVLDDEARRVWWHGREVELSPKEFLLLKVLMKHAGKTLSIEFLLNEVWGLDFAGDTKTVAVHVRWLRQKLEADSKHPALLKTVHRFGYRLDVPDKN
ncbi:MAG: response regulator transcription factor [Candidatus Melainabacteria bacterium]|nr:response regulator transcription factor [Candidatus Melainabacteria bacterium]